MAGRRTGRRGALQPRVLSAAHAGGHGEAARRAPAARAAQARVLLGDVRRGRLDARRHARRPCSRSAARASTARRTSRASARPREGMRAVLDEYRAHGIRHLVALRGDLPSGTVDAGEFRYANELVAFIRAETGDWFHIDVAAYPECHPQARNAAAGPRQLRAQGRGGRQLGDHAVLLQPGRVLELRRRLRATAASTCRSCRASCRSRASRSSRASRTPAAPRSRAGSAASSKASATTPRRSAPSASTSSRSCAPSLLERGAPGLHFYTLNQAGLTSTIWQRLGI